MMKLNKPSSKTLRHKGKIMNKLKALENIIKRKKEENDSNFEKRVESLVWAIEAKSQELRNLKKELTELTYQEVTIPDVSDCYE